MYGRSDRHARLAERNAEMVRLRLEERFTYRAIGEKFGITGGRVRDIVLTEMRRRTIPTWRELHDRVKQLEEALGFYADESNWPDPKSLFAHDVGNYAATNIDNDWGDIARKAIIKPE